MESFKVENLSFIYPDRSYKALDNINLTIKQGEFVLLCGESGCGKTTFLRLLKSSLSPFGQTGGSIFFNGKELASYGVREQASGIGFVMQNPDNQLVTDKVWHELAFGLESLGYKSNEIRTRVSEMASFFGIQNWFYKNVTELSGGQKQLLNLASVMVMQPSVLILDEPTSQLDPISAQEFLKTLEKINRELGTTIIITEHRLEEVFSIADRIVVMDEGKIVVEGKCEDVCKCLKDINHPVYKALPTPVKVYSEVECSYDYPLNVRDGRIWLEEYSKSHTLNSDVIPKDKPQEDNADTVIEIRDVWFRYEKDMPDVLKGFNLKVKKGELFSLVGGNGTGKSTAVSIASGLKKPYRGKVFIGGQKISEVEKLYSGMLGVLPQNPQSVFLKNTVYLDLMEILIQKSLSKEEMEQKIKAVSSMCKIEHCMQSHPYDLSGGEQQRAALAKILLLEPKILLLDEPTKGMDAQFKEEFADILTELKADGVTILMVSHDIEFCAKYADRCGLVFDGAIVSEGTPRKFFKGKSFYTTSANRMARTILPDAVIAEDVILACGGKIEKKEKKYRNTKSLNCEKNNTDVFCQENVRENIKLSKATLVSVFLILLLIPLTIFAGDFFGDRKYYFTSLLIIVEIMIPFFMVFESGKPKARELVLISVMCALAVAGRTVFYMLPQFKPVVALVIITGVCFGGETGFLVGAVTGFVSNFFFGQGAWTPWQMLGFGIIGFLAGILFEKSILKKNRIILSLFGFFSTLVIYGILVNFSSVIMWQNKITLEILVASWVVGLPADLVHSFATVFFLWFISKPMIEKLERVRTKYGLMSRR